MANDKWSGSNPWLGLAPYTEGTPLYGRTKESIQLADIIKDYTASVVFGKSGIGKSSLLSAGISPLLREENYIPVRIRLVHNTEVSYIEQIESKVRETVHCIDRLPTDVNNLGLWDFFHRHSFTAENGIECIPVIILDQFEEIYTLTDADHKKGIITFFNELSSLLNDIKPDNVIEEERKQSSVQNDSDSATPKRGIIKRSSASTFNYTSATTFRFVICLREDKLYLLERNSANIPSLKANRYNLQALSQESALEVIMCPRPELFSNEEATAIIDKLADMGDEGLQTIDPAILSLFLYKYYEKQGLANYDNIFADYYQEATKDIKGKSIAFLEDHLLTLGGYRNQVPLDDALSSGVTQEDIQSLLQSIIIRKEQRKGIDYIEFSHDRLCVEAKKNREERAMREQTRKVRKRMLLSFFVFAVSAAILAVVLWLTFKLQTSEEGRLSEKQQKELFKEKNDSLALLDAMNRRQTDSLIILNEKNLVQKQEIECQRDEINLSLQKQQEQNRMLKKQLAKIEEQQRIIDKLRSLTAVDSIVIERNIAGKLSDRLPYFALSKVSKLTVTGKLDASDIAYIKVAVELGRLKHLDLGNSYLVEEKSLSRNLNFEKAKSLETVSLPRNITEIGDGAFSGCLGLTDINIPEGVNSIGEGAFLDCINLTCINIPKGVVSIKRIAFKGCSNLTSINIPVNVNHIGDHAFANCFNVQSIVVAKGNSCFDSRDNCNAIIISSTNELVLGCANTIIPHSVISVGSDAFYGCRYLRSITIPDRVSSIGQDAFGYCTKLIHVCSEIRDVGRMRVSDSGMYLCEKDFYAHDDCVWQVPSGMVKEYISQPWWQSSWKISEDSLVTFKELGKAYASVGDENNSEKYYLQALQYMEILHQKSPELYLADLASTCWGLTLLYQAMKRDEEYDEMLRKAVGFYRLLYEKDKTASRNLADALNLMAYQYIKSAQYTLGMNMIEEAISLVPDEANYYDSKGEFLLMQDCNDEALQMWKLVIKCKPKFLDAYPDGTNLSNGLKKLGLIH